MLNIPKFLAVDFYCGAGGTTRGLLDAGGYGKVEILNTKKEYHYGQLQ